MSDVPAPVAEEERTADLAVHGLPAAEVRGGLVVHTDVARYLGLLEALRQEGYRFCSDVTAVDHMLNAARPLPEGITGERFEVVVTLRDFERRRVVRVRCQVPDAEPAVPSAFPLWPGTEAMEREVYDMFGIVFTGHPDLTRILMPEDWEGHPLRKDFAQGKVPVQFKAAKASR